MEATAIVEIQTWKRKPFGATVVIHKILKLRNVTQLAILKKRMLNMIFVNSKKKNQREME